MNDIAIVKAKLYSYYFEIQNGPLARGPRLSAIKPPHAVFELNKTSISWIYSSPNFFTKILCYGVIYRPTRKKQFIFMSLFTDMRKLLRFIYISDRIWEELSEFWVIFPIFPVPLPLLF
jgi:hypothetical protein